MVQHGLGFSTGSCARDASVRFRPDTRKGYGDEMGLKDDHRCISNLGTNFWKRDRNYALIEYLYTAS
jgi:hypothetical protein